MQIDLGRVPLVGANQRAGVIEGESLLGIGAHDFVEFGRGDGDAMFRSGGQEIGNRNPAAGSEREAERLRLVSEVLGEKLAHRGFAFVVHDREERRQGRGVRGDI